MQLNSRIEERGWLTITHDESDERGLETMST